MTGKKILVLGGGFGGAAAARKTRKLLGTEHSVTLVDRDRRTYLCGSFPMLIAGQKDPEKASRSLGTLDQRGVRFIQAEIQSIDTKNMTVLTSEGVLDFDFLIIALGASYDWEAVPGSKSSYSFYSIDEALKLRKRIRSFRKGKIMISVSSIPYKCPPAPFETAMILDWIFKQKGVRKEIDIDVYTPEPAPIRVAGPSASSQLIKSLTSRGISLNTGQSITEVSKDGKEVSISNGTSKNADLVITIPVHKPPNIVFESQLAEPGKWIDVSRDTLETNRENIFAIGDITSVKTNSGFLPKAGVFAYTAGEVVGTNIAARINHGEKVVFPGKGQCFIAYGGSSAGAIKGDFFAADQPKVKLIPPSVKLLKSKEYFEQRWRKFKI